MNPKTLILVCTSISGMILLTACSGQADDSVSPAPSTVSSVPATTVTTTESLSASSPHPPPTSEQTSTPTETQVPAGPAQCTTEQLAIDTMSQQGAAGSVIFELGFSNNGDQPCILDGFPGVSLVGFGNGTQIGAPAIRDTIQSSAVEIAPGGLARASLSISRAENYDDAACDMVPADGLRIYPPGETASAFVQIDGINGCSNADIELMNIKAIA